MQKNKKKGAAKDEENEHVKAGKEAIEMNKAASGKGGSTEEKNKNEEKDAEAWHNEG